MQKHRVSVAFQDCERWSLPLQAPTLKTPVHFFFFFKVLGRAEAFDTSDQNDYTPSSSRVGRVNKYYICNIFFGIYMSLGLVVRPHT